MSIGDAEATYCELTGAASACYRLSGAALGGFLPGEMAFAGRSEGGSLVVVQKVYRDDSDHYLVLSGRGGRMTVVGALPSDGELELPLAARFALSPDKQAIEQLRTDRDQLTVSLTDLGANR